MKRSSRRGKQFSLEDNLSLFSNEKFLNFLFFASLSLPPPSHSNHLFLFLPLSLSLILSHFLPSSLPKHTHAHMSTVRAEMLFLPSSTFTLRAPTHYTRMNAHPFIHPNNYRQTHKTWGDFFFYFSETHPRIQTIRFCFFLSLSFSCYLPPTLSIYLFLSLAHPLSRYLLSLSHTHIHSVSHSITFSVSISHAVVLILSLRNSSHCWHPVWRHCLNQVSEIMLSHYETDIQTISRLVPANCDCTMIGLVGSFLNRFSLHKLLATT